MYYCFEKEFLLLSSAAREIPDVSSVLEFSNWFLLVVLSFYWRLTWNFCYVFFFSVSSGFFLCSLDYTSVYCVTGQTWCCVNEGTLG